MRLRAFWTGVLWSTVVTANELPPGVAARLGGHRFVHHDGVRVLAFLDGGTNLFSQAGNSLYVWDIRSGERRFDRLIENGIMGTATTPDGRVTLLAENGPRLRVIEMARPRASRVLTGAKDRSMAIAISANGETAASGDGGTILIWNLNRSEIARRIQTPAQFISALAFSPDGSLLASDTRVALQLWDARTGEQLHRWDSSATYIAFSPNGRTLAAGLETRVSERVTREAFTCFDTESGKQVWQVPGTFNDASYSRDGSLIALPGLERVLTVSSETGKPVHTIRYGNLHVHAAVFSPDGRILATGAEDHKIRLWQTSEWAEIHPGIGHEGPVQTVTFSPDGRQIASGGLDGTIRFWSWPEGQEVKRIENVGSSWGVQNLEFSRQGTRLASFGHINWGHGVSVWEMSTGRRLSHFGSNMITRGMAFTTNENQLLTGSSEGAITLWDIITGERLRNIGTNRNGAVYGLKLLPGGDHVAWLSENSGVGLRDLASGSDLTFTPAMHSCCAQFAVAPDGSCLAVNYRAWDMISGELIWGDAPFPDDCQAAAISPDARLFAFARPNGITLWEKLTRREIHSFGTNLGAAHSIAFSPNGQFLAAAGHDGTVLVWNLTESETPLAPSEMEQAWATMGDTNDWAAHRAAWAFAKGGDAGAGFLARRLSPAIPLSAQELANLRSTFTNRSFELRALAARRLIDRGIKLAAHDWEALRQPPRWSRSADGRAPSHDEYLPPPKLEPLPDRLRSSRAILALEHSTSPAAKAALESLADGAANDPQTKEAKQSLSRMKERDRTKMGATTDGIH